MCCWGWMEKISWSDRLKNEVLQRDEYPTPSETKEVSLDWFHVVKKLPSETRY